MTYSFTFNAAGTYDFYCSNHGGPGGFGMSGTVTVEP
jgi:plastocyanin